MTNSWYSAKLLGKKTKPSRQCRHEVYNVWLALNRHIAALLFHVQIARRLHRTERSGEADAKEQALLGQSEIAPQVSGYGGCSLLRVAWKLVSIRTASPTSSLGCIARAGN